MRIMQRLGIYLLLFLMIGCKHHIDYDDLTFTQGVVNNDTVVVGNVCSPDSVYFQNDILPIFLSNCAMSGCHNSAIAAEGVVLVDYNSVISSGGIIPGNPFGSELYQEIYTNRMPPPPHAPLSQTQKDLIYKWIQQGAPNNSCVDTSACDTTNVTFSGSVQPILQKYCVGCHNNANANGNPPVMLDSYTNVIKVVNNGRLMGSLLGRQGYAKMPPSGSLSQCDIEKIRIWINNGAPNN